MKTTRRCIPLAFAFSICAKSTAVANTAAEFCAQYSDGCTRIKIFNQSATTVTKVNVTQEKTDGACEKKEESINQNLAGWAGDGGEAVFARILKTCQYKVKYVTTSGCIGDKTAYFKVGNFPGKYNAVKLKGGCGTLSTKKYTTIDAGDEFK